MRRQIRNSYFALIIAALCLFAASSAAQAACSNPPGSASDLKYNSSSNALQYCNGTNWIQMGGDPDNAQLPDVSGAVRHLKFDESAGSIAVDDTGNSNGTLQNFGDSPVWQPVGGQIGGALAFDGADDRVTVPSVALAAAFTVSWWYKTADNTQGGVQSVMIGEDAWNSVGAEFGLKNSNFYIGIGPTTPDNTVAAPAENAWHHVVVTRDAANKVDLYVDNGAPTRLFGDVAQTETFTLTRLGGDGLAITDLFSGLLDDVRVYDRAISAAEVNDLYTQGAEPPNLINHWDLDENSGLTAADSAGTKNGALQPATPSTGWQPAGGHHAGALQFDGAEDYVTTSIGGYSAPYTMSMWINLAENPAGTKTLAQGGRTGSCETKPRIQITANRALYVKTGGGCSAGNQKTTPDYILTVGAWHHLALVAQVVGWDLYLDGARIDYSTMVPSVSGAQACLSIGASFLGECTNPGASGFFKGMIDDFRIYGRALSAAEIKALYCPPGYVFYDRTYHVMRYCSDAGIVAMGPANLDTDIIAHWKLDESGATTNAADNTGWNDGTLINFADPSTAWQPAGGQFDGALDFDGSDDYIETSFVDISNRSFSLSAWAKRASSGTWDIIFGGGTGFANNGLHFGFRNTNVFTCSFWGNDLNTGATYTDTNWHHWVCTYDAVTNQRIIYRDTVSVANNTASADYQGVGNFRIGDSPVGTDAFHGLIDDARVYYKVLTPTEIGELFIGTAPVTGPGACANPARSEGVMIYNTNFNVMQYCDGTVWRKVGP
jgi:hypothetical protein